MPALCECVSRNLAYWCKPSIALTGATEAAQEAPRGAHGRGKVTATCFFFAIIGVLRPRPREFFCVPAHELTDVRIRNLEGAVLKCVLVPS